ncbi:MAG TPA: FtsH protease activity modulator HflK [Verrucomicrobiales bacterium]|nr:FtsH protease activity modulator HflK [Verrucomicrobiales bacterium]HCN75731.1 FtsH protease activity modulator HflK [Verrucomicrobiales bacterium]HRJ09475.1 FtsH protease activity modulator HflK [Prosthecobacter sp.]HRK15024.1 FtsH protease activity modulator HflK [Prosthecobacter sp.]
MPSPNTPQSPFSGPPNLQVNTTQILLGLAALLVIIGALSSFFQVPAEAVGVVQRFGKYHDTAQPGLNFKLPFGIDRVTVLETRRQLKLEFGYGTGGATNEMQFNPDRQDQMLEKNMVTGDLNAAVVEWVVQFTISDARDYLFNFLAPQQTLRDMSESVMREVVGDRTVDEVLTIGRQDIETRAFERLAELTRTLKMGVQIDQVQLGNVNPPVEVKNSFDEVNRAQQEKETAINQASSEYNRVIPEARGKAEQSISQAEGYATKRVNEAEGDAARFTAVLAEYQKAPEVTRRRIYLETLGEVLPAIPGKVIVDETLPQFLPLMHLQQPEPVSP